MNYGQILDLLVIAAYLAAIVFIAIKSKDSDSESSSFALSNRFLAGKSLNVFEVTFSIVATETSALTFLGLSAISFVSDFSFIQFYIGCFIARILHIFFYIPKIYDKGITLYEIVLQGGGGTHDAKKALSSVYFISKLVLIGVRLFSGSIIIAHFFNVGIASAIVVVALITASYCIFGGLKTVVRTDVLQFFLLVGAGIFSHYLIANMSSTSWIALVDQAYISGKLSFIGSKGMVSLVLSTLGGFFYAWAIGIDQDYVQRILGSKNMRTAQYGVALGTVFGVLIAILFLGIGTLLWGYYQTHTLPAGIVSDRIFANFIISYFPSPFRGLVIVGILAATMSTLDSAINALSSCLYNDIITGRDLKKFRFFQRLDTAIIIVAIVAVAIFSSKFPNMMILAAKLPAWTMGGLLGIVMSKLFFSRHMSVKLNLFTVIIVCFLSALGVYLCSIFFNTIWYFDYLVGLLISAVTLLIIQFVRRHR